jgi:HAD superfamily hydrolase (TIGR01490 family)
MAEPSATVVAFVDLDRTLVPVHTSLLYLRMLRTEGRVNAWALLRATWLLALYFLNAVDMQRVLAGVLLRARGDRDADGWERGRRCVDAAVLPRVGPTARRALLGHANQGHRICILSAGPEYLVLPLARALGVDGVGTRLAVGADGRLTGALEGEANFGPHKLTAARAYAARMGTTLDRCHFYTDSASDLPLMLEVGTPVAVNPDPRLARVARQKGWRVERW